MLLRLLHFPLCFFRFCPFALNFVNCLNCSCDDEILLTILGYPINALADWTMNIVENVFHYQHILIRCWVYDMFLSMSLSLSLISSTRVLSRELCLLTILSWCQHFVALDSNKSRSCNCCLTSQGILSVALICASCFACWATAPVVNSCSPSNLSYPVDFYSFPIIYDLNPNLCGVCFDSTLGFPGEGPDCWTCITANIDSSATNPQCASWSDDLVCIQETRVAQSNLKDTLCCIHSFNKEFFPGKLLDHTRQKNGVYRIPHGGVAILSDKAKTTSFSPKDDSTGAWNGLYASTRVSAVWHQVLPKLKLLCFTYYAKSWKQHDEEETHNHNDEILGKIFEVASQFGDIPVIVTADLQSEPEAFASFQVAKQSGWSDPLASFDQEGNSTRPVTFSRTSNFQDPENHCSSIDAILLNQVALTALQSVEICPGEAKQHAPIRATFLWPKVFVKGHIFQQPAPLILDDLPRDTKGCIDHQSIDRNANTLWNDNFQHRCDVDDDETTWKNINSYGISILLSSGAKFADGPHSRGMPPTFVSKTICPGQDSNGSAWCKRTAQLSKLHNLVSELVTRLSRPCSNSADMLNQWDLQQKVLSKISKIRAFDAFRLHENLNRDSLIAIQKKLHQLIVKAKEELKYKRINHWRNLMQKGTSSQKCLQKCLSVAS